MTHCLPVHCPSRWVRQRVLDAAYVDIVNERDTYNDVATYPSLLVDGIEGPEEGEDRARELDSWSNNDFVSGLGESINDPAQSTEERDGIDFDRGKTDSDHDRLAESMPNSLNEIVDGDDPKMTPLDTTDDSVTHDVEMNPARH